MSRSTDVLFQPFELGSMKLKNRIAMAPMTRGFAVNNIAGQPQVDYYRRRAEGEVGLILTEGTVVNRPTAHNEPQIPFFYGDSLDGWEQVAKEVHEAGGAIAPQIWHVGSCKSSSMEWEPDLPFESPSGLYKPGVERGRAMSEEDIVDTIAAFAQAARDARDRGFDCVEVHGAHGYLVDQFFWEGTNKRDDRWNGPNLGERSRFAAEIVREIKKATGDDFPLILRVSQWKQQEYTARLAQTPAEMEDWLCPLVDAGVDILHCSQRRFWEPEFDGSDLNLAGWTRRITGKPTITVGSVGLDGEFLEFMVKTDKVAQTQNIDGLLERLGKGEFDLVAVGRALIVDPQWADKVREGRFADILPFSREALKTLA